MIRTESNILLDGPTYSKSMTKAINLEASESSTGDSNQNGELSKSVEELDSISDKYKKGRRANKKGKNLNRKTKRSNFSFSNNKTKNKKEKNMIENIYTEFKSISCFYQKFPQFRRIENKIKDELYLSIDDFVRDIRNTISNIFVSLLTKLNYSNYNKIVILSEYFETIYKKYDNNSVMKQAVSTFDEINKMKREINKVEPGKNHMDSNRKINWGKNKNSTQIYKENVLNKINKLNIEQKKGILNIISNNLIDKNKDNIIEFNINKIPINQLKQLNKYINKCININIIINNNNQKNDSIEISKDDVSLDDDDFTSFLSDDESEDDDDLD